MKDVYSGAYCVFAACSATDHFSGFLKPRKPRDYVTISRDGNNGQSLIYICENIDNFKKHVLDGELSSRSWVLQEYALSRRTVFFTEHQTYFECGGGVRRKTSTKVNNTFAAFLGDPDFPRYLYQATRGEKILRILSLFQGYSRLGLSIPYDRPVVIHGLQKRLLRTIKVDGVFGVLDEGETRGLLRRTLLWCRGSDEASLTCIDFPKERTTLFPSWSVLDGIPWRNRLPRTRLR